MNIIFQINYKYNLKYQLNLSRIFKQLKRQKKEAISIMLKKILLILFTIFITNNVNAIFRDYHTFPHEIFNEFQRNKKLGYSTRFNTEEPCLYDLFEILSKNIILSPKQINRLILKLSYLLKQQKTNALLTESFFNENKEKALVLDYSKSNKFFIFPNFGANKKAFIKLIDVFYENNFIYENLKIKENLKLIFIENFYQNAANKKLETFIVIAILKIVNPNNVFIVQKAFKNEEVNQTIIKNETLMFKHFAQIYKEINKNKINYNDSIAVKKEVQNFHTYKNLYLNEDEKLRFIIAKNINNTINQMINILTFVTNKIAFYISYNKKTTPKNISLNKNFDCLLKTKNPKRNLSRFKRDKQQKLKIDKNSIYKISPTTPGYYRDDIYCIYKINSNLEIKKIRI
jgi:hypothetical protein